MEEYLKILKDKTFYENLLILSNTKIKDIYLFSINKNIKKHESYNVVSTVTYEQIEILENKYNINIFNELNNSILFEYTNYILNLINKIDTNNLKIINFNNIDKGFIFINNELLVNNKNLLDNIDFNTIDNINIGKYKNKDLYLYIIPNLKDILYIEDKFLYYNFIFNKEKYIINDLRVTYKPIYLKYNIKVNCFKKLIL